MSHYVANVKLYWNGTAVNATSGVLAFGAGDTVPDATVTRDGLATGGLVTSQPDGGTPTPTFPVTVVGTPTAGQIPAWNNSTHQWEPGPSPAATYMNFTAMAAEPDLLLSGAITRDSNGAATAGTLTWPDGATGAYTATTVSSSFPGAVDAYTLTRVVSGVTTTYTQSAVTRDATTGAVTNRPAITVV